MSPANEKPSTGRSPAIGRKGRKPEAAFDLWLQRGLHQMFDNVAAEPIPEDLLKLIDGDRSDS
ncbi:hypothetical protein [Rhizosaccharibacter radicis]|uniref:Anti-sigma factor NepR domain-containing protein n=1 Tax=Rhizosaccharibacter radicis TaxID=2782605 RepID=A0ABT1VWA7_9PROT|nr:hypothetical protein [Acetobacteraceae bacterium KSS12]